MFLNRPWSQIARCILAYATFTAMARATESDVPCVLKLRNGDFVLGSLESISENEVRWRSRHFTEPLVFPRSHVDGMKFAPNETRAKPDGEFFIELANRDSFFADVKSMNQQTINVESAQFGLCKLRRESVSRLSRNGPDRKVHPIPARLEDWNVSDARHWRREGSTFVSDKKMASLYANVRLPEKAAIELEIAWAQSPKSSAKPRFSIYLGTDESKTARQRAFSIEIWDENIVVQRQTENDADLASLRAMEDAGSMHLFVYLDQRAGQLIVYDASGGLLADLKLPYRMNESGLMFLNRGGQFRLNYLQVRNWSGSKPSDATSQPITVTTNADSIGGNSIKLTEGKLSLTTESDPDSDSDPDTEESNDRNAVSVSFDEVVQIDFPTDTTPVPASFVAGYHDGSRISGELHSANSTTFTVRVQSSDEPLQLPINSLRGFVFNHANPTTDFAKSSPNGLRFGKLEMMDTRLSGWLVDTNSAAGNDPEAACLVWKPALASNASPLKKNVFGRIVYRDPPKPTPRETNRNTQPARARLAFFGGIVGRNAIVTAKNKPSKSSRAVHLRSGDVIPCSVEKIDARGLHITSTMTESKLLPHDQVKAAQLVDNAMMPVLTVPKRERLLTLPRVQKNAPPLHLLFSTKGDVLRGSMLSLNDKELQMEVRLNPHVIPRNRVATIVWLHEDELEGAETPSGKSSNRTPTTEQDPEDRLLVQVVRNSGSRYSFAAESFADQTIYGDSDILKAMHVKVNEIDQLLLGGFIKGSAKTLKYGRWHLTPATDPNFVTATDKENATASETIPGTESPLVGLPAPDLKLKMLDEKTDFELAKHRGHCVVLDFWATWCGPCLQVMPVVEEVVSEFEAEGVQLFAVNLEERPAEIRATLERRQVHIAVALDRDGVAAARYEVTAIPQTVVIGPDGTVARVFVGSSRKLAEQLRAALKELTE